MTIPSRIRACIFRQSPAYKLHVAKSCLAMLGRSELTSLCKELIETALGELEAGQNLTEPPIGEEAFLISTGGSLS